MEQAISKLPTAPKFHLTASEPQLIPTRLNFLSVSCSRTSGSGSSADGGRSWEERILDLSSELQQICGSPLSPQCVFSNTAAGIVSPEIPQWLATSTTVVAASPTTPRSTATSPRPLTSSAGLTPDTRSAQWSTINPSLLTCSLGRYTAGDSAAVDLVRRAISLQARQSSELVRPIMVRHEETQETLAKRLSAICGQSSQAAGGGGAASALERSSKLRADEGSCRVRIKVDVLPYRVEDVVVAVSDGNRLTVDVYDGSTTRRIHCAELPPGVADCLLCHMNSSGSVYVHERPRGAGLTVEFVGTKSTFLPVIYCDENELVMTLVLRVPDDFRFEDLTVKTVDNSVWITGGVKQGTSTSRDLFSFPVGCGSRLTDGVQRCRFRVVVPLPKGCDNRSVVAALLSNNQLVLKARLSAACRRYTF